MKLNTAAAREKIYTAEGALAARQTAAQELRRTVMSCMLWEDNFYEDGQTIADRLSGLVRKVDAEAVSRIAIEARTDMKLRHVPLLLAVEMAKSPAHTPLLAETVENIIQRADELAEILAIYQKQNERTGTKKLNKLSKQLQKGIASAFRKFNEYQLAKYNRDGEIKLRDVLFLTHAKPKDRAQKALWKRLIEGNLETPDTWEVAITAAKGDPEKTKAEWTRLLLENKLGALALLRNLRNLTQAGVNKTLVRSSLQMADVSRVLPFRFVAAAVAAPEYEEYLDELLIKSAQQKAKLPGKTVLVVDISGSMYGHGNISARSDMTRVDAAAALAAIAREQCEEVVIYATAGDDYRRIHATQLVPNRHGFALVDVFRKRELQSQLGGGGIFLTQCLDFIARKEDSTADRIIVFTDEQDCDTKLNPAQANAFGKKNYLINISSEKNGIAYKPKWTHIDGFSEGVLEYIRAAESN